MRRFFSSGAGKAARRRALESEARRATARRICRFRTRFELCTGAFTDPFGFLGLTSVRRGARDRFRRGVSAREHSFFSPRSDVLVPREARGKDVDRRPRATGRSYRAYESRPVRVVNPARRPHRVGAYRVAPGRPFPDGGCIAGVPPAFHVGRVLFLERDTQTRAGSSRTARLAPAHHPRSDPPFTYPVSRPGRTSHVQPDHHADRRRPFPIPPPQTC